MKADRGKEQSEQQCREKKKKKKYHCHLFISGKG